MGHLNFTQDDKERILKAENNRGYVYYDFTEQSCKDAAEKPLKEVADNEWYMLVQMLFPQNLICSGIIDSFLIFEIKGGATLESGKRKDPPLRFWPNLTRANSKSEVLLKMIVDHLTENGVSVHETWTQRLEAASNPGA